VNNFTDYQNWGTWRTLRTGRARHAGLDFGAREGTPIYASLSGMVTGIATERVNISQEGSVIPSGRFGSWAGNFVEIRDALTRFTIYTHLHTVDVQEGQFVLAGRHIGSVGDTGFSLGAHLHFEISQIGAEITGNIAQTLNPRAASTNALPRELHTTQ